MSPGLGKIIMDNTMMGDDKLMCYSFEMGFSETLCLMPKLEDRF